MISPSNPTIGKLEEGFFLRFSSEELRSIRGWMTANNETDLKRMILKAASTPSSTQPHSVADVLKENLSNVDDIVSLASTFINTMKR